MADSNQTGVGGRYAQALFDLASDGDQIAAVENDLRALKSMRSDSADLRRLLGSPAFSAEDRAKALAAIAERAGFASTTRKFLGLLAANRRTDALPEVIDTYIRLSAQRRGVVAAEVITATPLTEAQTQGVRAALRQALGRDPEVTTRVDPSILGGLRVRVGSRLFDASLRSRLDQLKFALKRA